MTIAEIHGKISDTSTNISERMEDLLTSNIFGCMRYLPPKKVLLPFLHTACSLYGNTFTIPEGIVKIHYSFWPWLNLKSCIPCEPDLVLGLETEGKHINLVAIEAKYYSGLSSEEDERLEPNNQLARELDNLNIVTPRALGWDPKLTIISRTLLYITKDMRIPDDDLSRSLNEYTS